MFLAIDIGNTNIVCGLKPLKPGDGPSYATAPNDTFPHSWRIGTALHKTQDEYALTLRALLLEAEIDLEKILGVCICCVVPPLQNMFREMCEMLFENAELFVVSPGIKTGMPILYDNPKDVGADRIVNGIAAYNRFKKSSIIVDFGTATTFDFVDAQGNYAGGVICPGIAISAEALFQRTSKLPHVELVKPERVVGKSTVGSIQSGLYYGGVGMIDYIIDEILRETHSEPKNVAVLATGGLAPLLVPGCKRLKSIFPQLTLEGLEIIFYLNRK